MDTNAERTWRRIAGVAGYVVGASLLVGTILFLLDSLDALGAGPDYHPTGAPLQDEADFWVRFFAHQHHILWDIMARDTLFPLAFVTLIVLGLAARALAAPGRPEGDLMVSFFVAGGVISALADLIYLGEAEWWRITGWAADPPARMVAIGRSTEAVDRLTTWPEAAGFVVLAAALVCLGRLCRRSAELPSRLALAAYIEALLLLGIAVAGVLHNDTLYNISSLLTGALFGPLVAVWLGRSLSRRVVTEPQAATVPAP
jgi:hypothetical protein